MSKSEDNNKFPNVTHYTQVDVQPGGINIQHVEHLHQADVLKALGIELEIKKDGQPIDVKPQEENNANLANSQGELSLFIFPGLEENEAKRVERQIRDLVHRRNIPDICSFLKGLKEAKKILLPQSPQVAFDELHRLGMPSEETEGFSRNNFFKYYNK